MNQILQVEMKKNKKQKTSIKKVIMFLAICLILFGIILLAIGISSSLYTKNKENDNNNNVVVASKPNIEVQKADNELIVKFSHDKAISEITYSWNEEEATVIDTDNELSYSISLDIPRGTNTVHITALDINGEISTYDEEYTVEIQSQKPVISLSVTNENKIKVQVEDANELKEVTYTWNNGDSTTIQPNTTNKNIVEVEIDIPYGQNTLKVTATDVQNESATKELDVKGINKPKVTVERQGDSLLIIATDDNLMEVVNYTLNGKRYQLKFNQPSKEMRYLQPLEEGENTLILTAENVDGGITEFRGKCTK